ncbi:WD40 repeat domain-containing protein [Streptosporangium sp. NPDC001682]
MSAALILVIDQFEEVFTLVDERRREAFITCLAQAASARAGALEQPPALVVLSVRGDFLERCAAHPPLLEALRGGSFLVGPMSRTELIRAVTGPAAEAGLEVEPGLLEAVLGDLDSQGHFNAGVLPLLSQAMLSTWENREENRLTIRGYGLGGGVARAVQTSAEDAYEGLLAPHRLALTPHIFRRMTVVAHDGRPALRSANREELYALGQKDDVDAVLNAFATRRLIVLGHHAADIAHECLLQVWPRLRGWLEEDLADHAVYRDLFEDAQDWERSGRDAAYLYRGERLANLRRLIPRWENNPTLPLPLPASARDFLTAAGRAESRAKRIRRALLIALTGLLIVAVTAAVAAVAAQRQAVRVQEEIAGQRDLAVSRRAATQSESLAGQPALSALLATAAWRISPTPEARASMIDAVLRPGRAVLDGHTSEVGSIAFSPDGRLMASGGTADHSVRLWDVAARRQVGEPLAHDGDVTSVAFSPDGRTLAGAGSGAITFWDVATRTPIQPPFTRVDGGSAIAFSPDGHLLASAASGELRLWNVATRESTSVAKTRSLGDIPAAVAFSPTGKVVASVTERNTVRLWDARTHRQIGLAILETGDQITTDPHQLVRTAVTFSPTGRTLAIVSGIEGVVRLFDTATQRMIGRLSGNPSGITSVAFSPDGHTLISVGEDVRLWDVTSRKPIGAALTGHTSTVTAVAASQDGHTVATGSSSGPIRLWDVTASRPSGGALRGRNPNVIALAFSPDSRLLATGAVDNTVRLWDVNGRERMGTTLSRKGNLTAGLAFSPNGRRLAAGTRTSWDVATRKAIPAPPNAGESADAMAFRPDGRVIASAGDDEGGIRLWDATGRSPGRALSGHDTRVTAMAFSPDATTLASGAADGSLRLWDTAARRPRDVPLSGHSQYVVSLAFTSKGDLLASSALDGTVRVWDVRSGKQRGTPLTGQDGYVHTVVFSPDGRTLATANSTSDGTVQLWDVATMRPIGNPVAGPGDYVRAVAFSPDGRLLAIADTEAVRLWETGLPADPYVAACAISARDLTPAEWGQHLDEVAFRTVCRD